MDLKKVLFINYSYSVGSTGKIVEEIGQALEDVGVETFYVCKKSPVKRNNIHIVGSKIRNNYAGLFSRITGLQGYGCWKQTKLVVEYIDKIKPDVVHLHNLHGNYLNIRLLFDYLNKSNIKIVWTMHDCWPFTGNCAFPSLENCEKWYDGLQCDHCPNKHSYPPSWFFDFASKMLRDKKRMFDCSKLNVVTVSQWLEGEVRKSILKNSSIKTIYNWIDTNDFFEIRDEKISKKRKAYKNEFLFLSVASDWSEAKGISYILEAAETLGEKFGFIIIGKCSEKFKKNISNVYFAGPVLERSKLAEYYNICDYLLSVSKAETFGLTIAEAMACGKPGIVNNTSACPEIVGDCGVVIETPTPENIKKAAEQLMGLSLDCHGRVKNLFSAEKNICEYIKLYEKIVD